jgi:DNA topoisomerase-1
MSKYVVVVESPAKAKTIEKYLGKDYKVVASYGHVRDLIPKTGAVEPDNGFKMHYEIIDRNAKHVTTISKLLQGADALVLATDPDREGEAIAWHLYELLSAKKSMKEKKFSRVVFHQITKKAVLDAMATPRDLAMDLVNAQQARRALDYLVGFNLSPLCWKKIRPGLSAGRVQSPALRMICERELEIAAFKSREYWSIHGEVQVEESEVRAKLIVYNGEKLEQFHLETAEQANKAVAHIITAADGKLTVGTITKKKRQRNPAPPFITSTLQQEASRKLGFSTQKTMQIAQQLYEGIDLHEGTVGLITYMRTDSIALAKEAVDELRETIVERYGKENCPAIPREYKTKSKNAQEAHEAIRPTSAKRHPDDVEKQLTRDQFRLYQLIWKRTMASQMENALLNLVSVDLEAANHVFRANGSTVVFFGFMMVYQEGVDDKEIEDAAAERLLPPMKEGQILLLKEVIPTQHFTEPAPRYTEASLVKSLEEHGIGRPSTYASIIATLKNREYVELNNKRFHATDIGMVVSRFLTNYFTQYVDYDFTARLEDELDAVSRGEKTWIPVLEEFWTPFKKRIDQTHESVTRAEVTEEKTEEKCPQCQSSLVIKLGKRGRFYGCTGYPDCSYTRDAGGESEVIQEAIDRDCPKCKAKLLIRHGRYGKFIGCAAYPDCRHMEPLSKPKETGVKCPKCKAGVIVERRSKRGKVFFSCDKYPTCQYALWNEPVNESCPACQWPILTIKETKRAGREKLCPQENCSYKVAVPDEQDQLSENI